MSTVKCLFSVVEKNFFDWGKANLGLLGWISFRTGQMLFLPSRSNKQVCWWAGIGLADTRMLFAGHPGHLANQNLVRFPNPRASEPSHLHLFQKAPQSKMGRWVLASSSYDIWVFSKLGDGDLAVIWSDCCGRVKITVQSSTHNKECFVYIFTRV